MESENYIGQALKLLKPKAEQYEAEWTKYYITLSDGEDGTPRETESYEDFCENCINAAIVDFKEKFFLERAQLLLQMAYVKEYGYYLYRYGISEYAHKSGCEVVFELSDGGAIVKAVIPSKAKMKHMRIFQQLKKLKKNTKFGYETQDSPGTQNSGFDTCEGCGRLFNGVRVDNQELEHWEGYSDEELKIENLSINESFQLYEILLNYREYSDSLEERVIAIAKKIK